MFFLVLKYLSFFSQKCGFAYVWYVLKAFFCFGSFVCAAMIAAYTLHIYSRHWINLSFPIFLFLLFLCYPTHVKIWLFLSLAFFCYCVIHHHGFTLFTYPVYRESLCHFARSSRAGSWCIHPRQRYLGTGLCFLRTLILVSSIWCSKFEFDRVGAIGSIAWYARAAWNI